MKKMLIAALAGGFSVITLTCAQAADSAGTANQPATVKQRVAYKKNLLHRKTAAAPSDGLIPNGSVKWLCQDNKALYVNGDLKRDMVLTVHWARRNYKLPRQSTTTGADRFHDPASGLDLVVIPSKAMLFNDKNASRLADECKTQAMAQTSVTAPSSLNQLRLLNQK